MSAQSFRTLVLPANAAARETISGRYYATVTTTGPFYVRTNNGPELEQNAGRTFGNDNAEFSALTFYNRTGAAVTLTYYVGNVPYQPDPSVVATIASLTVQVSSIVQNKATVTQGSGKLVLANGNAVNLINANRRQMVIRNHAASAGVLQVCDAGGNVIDELNPGDPPWTWETNGNMQLKASGGNCTYSFGQTIYV